MSNDVRIEGGRILGPAPLIEERIARSFGVDARQIDASGKITAGGIGRQLRQAGAGGVPTQEIHQAVKRPAGSSFASVTGGLGLAVLAAIAFMLTLLFAGGD